MYLCWFQDDKRTTVAQRVHNAIEAYKARFSRAPSVVLMNTDELATLNAGAVDGIAVDGKAYIHSSNYWVGMV